MIQVRLADGRAFLLEPELEVTLSFGDENHVFKVEDIGELRMPLAEIVQASGRNGRGDTIRVLMFQDPSGVTVTGPPITPAMNDELVKGLSEKRIDTFTSIPDGLPEL